MYLRLTAEKRRTVDGYQLFAAPINGVFICKFTDIADWVY
jgi:hypothetical protein